MSSKLETCLTSPPEPNVCAYIHEGFPPGHKIGSPRIGCRELRSLSVSGHSKGGTAKKNSSMSSLRSETTDKPRNWTLPRLPTYINSPQSLFKRKTNCSFINNHKSYLKLKGFELNDVYSVKRHNKWKDNGAASRQSTRSKLDQLSNSTLDLPSLFNNELINARKKNKKSKETTDVWRPHDSRKGGNGTQMYRPPIHGLDNNARMLGHVNADNLTSNRLGKALTRTQMRTLLGEQEEPVIPNGFYMKCVREVQYSEK